ncbi:cytochrome P450 [Stemphylium lycopersici]|nr:cytochrome P450 [Stemphylium lycopersici]
MTQPNPTLGIPNPTSTLYAEHGEYGKYGKYGDVTPSTSQIAQSGTRRINPDLSIIQTMVPVLQRCRSTVPSQFMNASTNHSKLAALSSFHMTGTIQSIVAKVRGVELLSARGVGIFFAALFVFQIVQGVARAVYNVYFHPLSKYPGPRLWAAFDLAKAIGRIRGRIDFQIAEEHRKHGEVVRIGTNELSFINPNAWKDIYGHGHAELQKYYQPNTMNPKQIIAANPRDHFRMRRAMLPAFSEKALAQQERLIRVYIDLLVQRLAEYAQSGRPADMAHWYNLTTFDLIADLCFGKSLEGLEAGKSNGWIEQIEKMLKIMPMLMLATSFPLLMKVFTSIFGKRIEQSRRKHHDYAASLAMSRIAGKEQADRGDFMDFILRSRGEAHQLTDEELTPHAYKRVTEESKTNVGIHQFSAYHSPLNFHDPETFHPERWLPEVYSDHSSLFRNDRRDVYKPFSFGPRDCIGRNLASLEMRLILALVLWHFDLSLDKGMEQWHVQRIFGLWEKPALKVNITQRLQT